ENRCSGHARAFKCLVRRENRCSGHARLFIVLGEKTDQEVTQGRSSCPAQSEKRSSGHAGAFNVPSSARKWLKRERMGGQSSRVGERSEQGVRQGRATCRLRRRRGGSGRARWVE